MSHIFISYSRKDLDFAQKIVDALATNNLDTWIDWKSIPKGEDWEQEIYRGIEAADAFLFLISPDSIASEMCNKEIAHAVKNGKRILPIVIRDTKQKSIHPEISKRNWIFLRVRLDDFNQAIEETRKTIHTDYEWLKYHTELQAKALKWERENDISRLLRGKELQEAEERLITAGVQKDPQPTELQRQYILKSQINGKQQRRRITGGLSAGLVIVIFLAIVAWQQRNLAVAETNAKATALVNEEIARNTAVVEADARATAQYNAEDKARIARARELAAQSVALRNKNFMVSLLLGIEGYRMDDNPQTRGALMDNTRAHPQLRRYLSNHTVSVQDLAFSPDGKTLASADAHGNIVLWDAESGKAINNSLAGYQLAFSPDGKMLAASGGDDSDMILWDVSTGQPIYQPVQGHTTGISDIAFSPDGKIIASGDYDSNVIIWDASKGQPIRNLAGHTNWIFSVAFSPDSKILASAGVDNQIILWNTITWQPINTLVGHSGAVQSLAFNSDGTTLASGSNDTTVILWDIARGRQIGQPLFGHSDAVLSVAYSPDDKRLVSGGTDGNIILWDVASRQAIGEPLTGHTDWVTTVAFSPDGESLISGSQDSSIIIWDLAQAQSISQSLRGHTDTIWSVTFSPEGKLVASGSKDGSIILWNAFTGQPIGQPLTGHSGAVNSVAFSPDGKILSSGGEDRNIILWDVASGRQIGLPLTGHTDIVLSVAFSPDGKTLASGGDTRVILWDVSSRKVIGQPFTKHTNWVESVMFSPDGEMLASGSWDGSIILWSIISGQPIDQPLTDNAERLRSVAFSPDGKILVSGGVDDDGGVLDNSITFWDIASKQISAGHTGDVSSVTFSPNGRLLASAGGNNNIILWDVSTHQPIGDPLTGHSGWINSVAFSPDGNRLVSGGAEDHTVILWDLNPDSWVDKACGRVSRNFNEAEWQQYFPGETYRATCSQWTREAEAVQTQPETTESPMIGSTSSTVSEKSDSCDEFDTVQLSTEWLWINPSNDARYSLMENPGYLRLRVDGRGHDLYLNLDAPRVVKRIEGDFIAETRLIINPVQSYQGAGLLLWQDENNYVRLERALVDQIDMLYRINGQYQEMAVKYANPTTYLQMQLVGNELFSRYSDDGIVWTELASVHLMNAKENLVGLDLINEWQDETIQADFDYFYLGNCK